MATLAGSTIASTYTYLLKMDGTSGVTSSLVKVEDGDATDTSLSVSTVAISVDATDKIYLDAGSDTYIYESGADVLDFYVGGANMLKLTESTLDTIAMIGNTTLTHTVTTAASTPIGLLIDSNTSGVAAQDSVGMHLDFDRTVAGSGTAAHNDIGINLDVNSASLGTSSLVGMDIDVVGATSGTSTATGLAVTVGSADTNYAALFTGGNVGIGTSAPTAKLHVEGGGIYANAVQSDTIFTGGPSTSTAILGPDGYWAIRSATNESFNLDVFNSNSEKVALTVLQDGKVGIGTSSPDAKLELETDAADQELRLSCHSDTEAHTNTLSFLKSDNTAASPATIDSGAVIGTIAYYGYDDNGYDTGAKIVVAADANWGSTERGTKMSFYTRDANESISENLVIAADGNVGIGLSNPIDMLTLGKSTGSSLALTRVDALTSIDDTHLIGELNFRGGPDTAGAQENGAAIHCYADEDWGSSDFPTSMRFYTSPDGGTLTERMRIDSSGRVGIGCNDPSTFGALNSSSISLVIGEGGSSGSANVNLTIASDDTGNGRVAFTDTEDTTSQAWILYDHNTDVMDFYSNGAVRMRIDDAGNLGIGDLSPDAHLDVENATITSSGSYTGIYSNHTVTGGDGDSSDNFIGVRGFFGFNDSGESFGSLYGGHFHADAVATADEESTAIYGTYTLAGMAGTHTDVNNIYGSYVKTDIDAGTVDSEVYGVYVEVDVESAATVTSHIYGVSIFMDCDEDPGGTARVFHSNYQTNVDYSLQMYDGINATDRFQVTAAGVVNAEGAINASQSLDYAEYFESSDGSVIPVGTSVKLDSSKIVACEEGDTPLGVIRPVSSSAVIGGGQLFHWKEKFAKDDYGVDIWEDYSRTKWSEEITFEEYIARGKDETGGVEGGNVKDKKVEGSKAIEAKDAVEAVEAQDAVYETVTKQRQKVVVSEVEEEVSSTEIVLEDGKYVQKTTTKTVTKEVKTPQYEEVTLYDEDGEEIGTHQVPIMEDYEEEQLVSEAVTGVVGIAAVEAVDAVPDTYFRVHKYQSDKLPSGVTAPDDAETITTGKRQKVNSDYDASKNESYKSREERDEWHIVGLLGQIPITKGQPTGNWVKMKDVSDTVEMYFVK